MMTTSFNKNSFSIESLRNLCSYKSDSESTPEEWAHEQSSNLKVGDMLICFDPIPTPDQEVKELVATSIIIVFSRTNDTSMGILMSDDFYALDSVERGIKKQASSAASRKSSLWLAKTSLKTDLDNQAISNLESMSRWGTRGMRSNAPNSLPDPLTFFLSNLNIQTSSPTPIKVSNIAIALSKGEDLPVVSDLSSYYNLIGINAAERISSVTLIEEQNKNLAQTNLDDKNNIAKAENKSINKENQSLSVSSILGSFRQRRQKAAKKNLENDSNKTDVQDNSVQGRNRSEQISSVAKLLSNIRQQISIANDNLDFRVSNIKTKMLDQVLVSKQSLNTKEKSLLEVVEELRANSQTKLKEKSSTAKDSLSLRASKGEAEIANFQNLASEILLNILDKEELEINKLTEEAKQKLVSNQLADLDELAKTSTQAQNLIRNIARTSESTFNQYLSQTLTFMDEKLTSVKAESEILAEGIASSIEALAEATLVQAKRAEESITKRLEQTSEEALQSLKDHTSKAEVDTSKLMDKLVKEKLTPALQEKKQYAIDLSSSFQQDFTNSLKRLMEGKLTEFGPLVRANNEFYTSNLREFRLSWSNTLDRNKRTLEAIISDLDAKVEDYLSTAKVQVDSLQDFSRVTENVLSSPELLRSRDETCLKFEMLSKEYLARAYAQIGSGAQDKKHESLNDLIRIREHAQQKLRHRGDESRNKIRKEIKASLQKLHEIQIMYTAKLS